MFYAISFLKKFIHRYQIFRISVGNVSKKAGTPVLQYQAFIDSLNIYYTSSSE